MSRFSFRTFAPLAAAAALALLVSVGFAAIAVAQAEKAQAESSANPDPAKGTLRNGYVNCKFVTRAKNNAGVVVDVPFEVDYWLPAEYAAEPNRRFPVIYILQNMDVPRKEMSEMFKKGQFPPFIAIHTDGVRQPLNKGENGVWSDSQGPAGTIFRTEIIGWVDRHFRTILGRLGRVLIGCSKAGGGVMHLGLNHPDLFAAVVSADGSMGMYDTGNNDGDFYTKNKLTHLDALQRHGDLAKNMPTQMLLGSMFGSAGKDDKHLNKLKAAGMLGLDYQDVRHFGHACSPMTADRFPEIMATFYNGIGDFAPWLPTVSHRAGVYAAPFDATIALPHKGWTIRYTLDGSDPHKGGATTAGPVRIATTCWLRAIGLSPDGKEQSRENLIRYTIQPPLSATAPGNQPGLTVSAYDIASGGARAVQESVEKIQKGSFKPLAHAVAPRLGETPESIAKVADKTKFLLYTGTLTVPETGVYEFDPTDCNGVYFPRHDRPWTEIGRTFASGIGTVQIPLEKGSHPIVIYQGNKSSKTVELRARRESTAAFAPIPAECYRH